MKKCHLLLAVLLFLISSTTSAQLLWKISGNGLEKTSYLFGTHHLIKNDELKGFDQILNLSGQVDAVVGEIEITDPKEQAAMMMPLLVMKDTLIKDLVGADDYTLLDVEFKKMMGVGMDQLGSLKPAFLSTMYAVTSFMKENNMTQPAEGLDIQFQKKAKELNKKVLALETFDQQIRLMFGCTSLKRQAELLMLDMKDIEKSKEDFKKLNALYLAGNLDGLESLMNETSHMTPDEQKVIVDNRNLDWIKQLPAMLSQQSCFIAVGCLHLAGKTGLVKQLKAAGYKLEPVVF